VAACRYPPQGERSNGPVRAGLGEPLGAYQQRANHEVLCLAMIETTEALAALEEIAAVPGLDGLYVGPTDLSLSLGLAPRLDTEEPALLDALDTVLGVARAHDLIPGMHTGSAAYSRQMVARGFRLVTVGTDATYLADGARAALTQVRAHAE
jgi:4-hydroxy-2-oxoheptanedioate aldolase